MPLLRGMRSAAKWVWIFVFVAFVGGFLLLETSGLLGSDAISPSTAVATVNGRDILYVDWANRLEAATQDQSNQLGRPLTLDEVRAIENRILDEMVLEILLEKEYQRRGITVANEEIIRAAELMPPPQFLQSADFQTDGRFDPEKYRRFLASPQARAGGVLASLEAYYRNEIPRLKLFEQVTADVYVTDAEMWRKWQDVHDSVQISFVALTPESARDSSPVEVTDAEIRAYYEANKESFDQVGRALVTVAVVPREITQADSAAASAKINALRNEITAGAKFDEVARRESHDTATAGEGGSLGRSIRGRYTDEFETAAYALRPGQVSQPVLSSVGYHLIRLDDRKGDTLDLSHILIEIRQSNSASVALDRRADSLTALAAGATDPAKFDSATRRLNMTGQQGLVFEGQPMTIGGRYIPSVSAWAFSGAQPGETSDLFDADDGYYLARLDSIVEGGVQPLSDVRDGIRQRLVQEKRVALLVPIAQRIASRAAATTLEAAAAEGGVGVEKSSMFSRISFVQGIGRENEAIGAAFELPVGSIGNPVSTEDAVFVLRVDKRVNAERENWEKQREVQRTILTQSMQQEKVQKFLAGLRESAKVVDHRKEIAQLGRSAT